MSAPSLYPSIGEKWMVHLHHPSIRLIQAHNITNTTATFQQESVGHVGNIVDMVICCLSFVGAIAIILPYIFNRRSRKLRHALILGLATSDLATSIVIIITTACLLANINLVEHHSPCSFLGYIVSSSIFSQHLWNLAIAVVTYMILVHPLSSFTLTVEKRVRWLWPIFWLVSFVINAIPFGFGGFGFRGGYCAFTTGFYFSSIFRFVPRGVVFIVILCLYTHLFFFLRRTNLFSKANTSNSISHSRHRSMQQNAHIQSIPHHHHHQHNCQLQDKTEQGALIAQQPLLHHLAASPLDKLSSTAKAPGSSAPSSAAAHSRNPSTGSRATPNILNKNDPAAPIANPRRSSSLLEKEASVEMSTFDPSSRRKDSSIDPASDAAAEDGQADTLLSALVSYSSNNNNRDEHPSSGATATATPLATYGLLDPNYSMASPRPMPSNLDIEKANGPHYDSLSISPHSPSNSSTGGEGARTTTQSNQGSSAPLNGSFPRDSADSATTRKAGATDAATSASKRRFTVEAATRGDGQIGDKDQRRTSLGDSRYRPCGNSSSDAESQGSDAESEESDDFGNRPMRPRKDATDFDMITPPREHLKHYTAPLRNYARMADILAMGEDEMARARNGGGNNSIGAERRGSAVQILAGEVVVDMPSKEAFDEALGDDWNWGMDVTRGAHPHHSCNSRKLRSGMNNNNMSTKEEAGVNTGTSSTSSLDENGVDAIGSTLNRQASLLLLLYPAAYCLLFSISIARLFVDLADPGASVRNAHDWLHQLSRWLIFAQGAIDALIFQFIERQFRQRMKRRRRKAMGETVEDSFTHRVGKKAVGKLRKRWNQTRSKAEH
ncbi:hypothetical protein NDA10_008072 [Ustilago hordei]|nr:hypothetical protein NDA10_008072 [Ustilago hordei]UTT90871.1 hypothetical protein NDA17_006782 [Ustilago hordei]